MTTLVTGATGFIGSAVVDRLVAEGRHVRAVSRSTGDGHGNAAVERVAIDGMDASTDWRSALREVDTVMHLAARVHVMDDRSADPLTEFRRVNVDGTLALARQAADCGVQRFVFVSSIKVNGEVGSFRESDQPTPTDPYGISKYEAEEGLREISGARGLEVVVVRPPLVYGPGVRANFRALINLVKRGVPLPFGAIHNSRSMVGLSNLVDFLARCLYHERAVGETFFISDEDDVSTTQLVRRIAEALDRQTLLIPVPKSLLWAAATLVGKRAVAQRLLGSLQLDISKARRLLDWAPPSSMQDELRRTVQ